MSYANARGASGFGSGSNLLIGWINPMVSNRETILDLVITRVIRIADPVTPGQGHAVI